MEREKIISTCSQSKVELEESRIKTFSKDSRIHTSYRVYDGSSVGIKYVQGRTDDEKGFAKAKENLALLRPYKFTLETGSRHRDKTEASCSDKELMDIARQVLDYLKEHHPDFIVSGSVTSERNFLSMENSLGLDHSNTDGNVSVNICFKHKDSKDIDDGWFGLGQRTFDFRKFTDMADNYLSNFTNIVELPEELIIQSQYYEYTGKFWEMLNAENLALGTSLLSGKTGGKVFADDFTLLHDVSDEETWNHTFFDGEGVVLPEDKHIFIENGVLLGGFADKRIADKYGVPHTGSADFNFVDTPNNGRVNFRIKRSEKTVKELLDGRLSVVPVRAHGGGYNEKGEYVTPVECAMLCDGERFIGRLPEFAVKGSIFDMFGKDFIGVGSDNPIFNDKQVLMKMNYSK
ncbi:PmbA protein [Ruminococcaceae bacterium FB2012]|nr:PmbA protein [Ruminococcaceae bacterium FB2012]